MNVKTGILSDDDLKKANLPDGWVRTKLGNITDVIRGASPRPKGDPRYFGGNIPWIMISDITREKGKIILQTKDHVTEEGAKKSRFLKKGNLILSNSGTVCVPKILGVAGCIHDGFVAFPTLIQNIDILYAYYWFEYIRPKIILDNKQGITQVNLNTTIVKNIDIILPPLPEQKRIVAKIESIFTQIDVAKERLEVLASQVKSSSGSLSMLKSSILKQAFEGGLVPQDPNDEPAEILLRKIHKDSTKELIFEKDNLPKGWVQINYGEIVNKIPLTEKKLKQKEYQKKGKLPVIDQGLDFIGGYTDKSDLNLNCVLPVIIFGDHTRNIKFVNQEFVAGADGIKVLKPNINLNPKLIYYFTKTISLPNKGYARHYQYLEKAIINIPPLNEQKRIVSKIESIFGRIDAINSLVNDSLLKLDLLKKTTLKHAFEGKLVPQDPNDESAEILLERIKQEKQQLIEKQKRTKSTKNVK